MIIDIKTLSEIGKMPYFCRNHRIDRMKVLVLGSGGREHAIAWRIGIEIGNKNVYIAPGNGGTNFEFNNVSLSPLDFDGVFSFVRDKQIDMIVVGPEEPLVRGIADAFRQQADLQHVYFVGPSAAGALLEGSKDFAKGFMNRHSIPTARYKSFRSSDTKNAKEFLKTLSPPYVIKADGLAAGKGVVILDQLSEAEAHIDYVFNSGIFGQAGEMLVIEEYLHGIEVSVFVATDGKHFVVLPEAKDYKRIGEGDSGLNTGGMGAISPVAFADCAFMDKVINRIVIPSVKGLDEEKISFKGFLFIGLMNCKGDPYVIEYNVRLGDPETEAILPRIESSFVSLLQMISKGNLNEYKIDISSKTAVTIVLASGGYPGTYQKGLPISASNTEEAFVFHAGTVMMDGILSTNGGRVIAVTAIGEDISSARMNAMNTADSIVFEGKYFRKDIGKDLLEYDS